MQVLSLILQDIQALNPESNYYALIERFGFAIGTAAFLIVILVLLVWYLLRSNGTLVKQNQTQVHSELVRLADKMSSISDDIKETSVMIRTALNILIKRTVTDDEKGDNSGG